MAYQNVGTCRFYVDYLLWLKTLGLPYIISPENTANPLEGETTYPLGEYDSYLDSSVLQSTISLNPSNQITLYNYEISEEWEYIQLPASPAIAHPTIAGQNTRYFAVLGHNIHSANSSINISTESPYPQNVVNLDTQYDGFSIGINYGGLEAGEEGFDKAYRIWFRDGTNNLKVGCYSVGNYYDMPHSPDLKLTMTREMDGVKRIRTKGGADLVDHKYTKPAMWGNSGAWELYDGTPLNQNLSRSGRRVWDLSFSYLDQSDVFGSNPLIGQYTGGVVLTEADGWDGDDIADANNTMFSNNLLDDNNFYSQVIHKTNGGQLPFIFQPDNSSNHTDNFAICKFDMNSFKFEQVANGVYNVKLKIREAW